jgi:replicative DNA helicase
MYQWGRDLAVRFDCPIIATSQISADGDGECFPTLPMLKDSKTGKQGAADLIITIGTSNDPSLEAMRFIGTTKNKLRLEGRPQTPRAQMMMDATGGRYVSA